MRSPALPLEGVREPMTGTPAGPDGRRGGRGRCRPAAPDRGAECGCGAAALEGECAPGWEFRFIETDRGGGDHHEDRGSDDGGEQPAVRVPRAGCGAGPWSVGCSAGDCRGGSGAGVGRGGGGRPPWASRARRTALSIAPRARRLGVPGGVSAACPSVIGSSTSNTARVGAVPHRGPPARGCSARTGHGPSTSAPHGGP